MVGYVAIVAKYLEEKLWFKSVALDRNLGTFFINFKAYSNANGISILYTVCVYISKNRQQQMDYNGK